MRADRFHKKLASYTRSAQARLLFGPAELSRAVHVQGWCVWAKHTERTCVRRVRVSSCLVQQAAVCACVCVCVVHTLHAVVTIRKPQCVCVCVCVCACTFTRLFVRVYACVCACACKIPWTLKTTPTLDPPKVVRSLSTLSCRVVGGTVASFPLGASRCVASPNTRVAHGNMRRNVCGVAWNTKPERARNVHHKTCTCFWRKALTVLDNHVPTHFEVCDN